MAKSLGQNLRHLHSYFVLFTMVVLSSCSHVKNDGPPNFYVDETKIPNAVPKPERLSKSGNMPSYTVFGKRYYTLRSSKNYDQVGTASWYGTKFHARYTSNGERYNMLGMTAAHKTLPLPTYVEVTNLRNNRKVIVKVNDRGPFESNRLIDLSYVAAKKLGMLGHGTAKVRVKAIDPYHYGRNYQFASTTSTKHHTTHSSSKITSHSNKTIYLQVGAFRNKSNAERLQQRLSRKVSAPVIITKGKMYNVKVGPFENSADSAHVTHQLYNLGFKPNRA